MWSLMREPLERIQGLEVSSERWVHPRAVVGGGVLETLLVFGRDRLAYVGRDTGMSPGEQLLDQLLGDRSLVEQAAEQPLADEPHQPLGVPFHRRVP
jgi:hypothetical protein